MAEPKRTDYLPPEVYSWRIQEALQRGNQLSFCFHSYLATYVMAGHCMPQSQQTAATAKRKAASHGHRFRPLKEKEDLNDTQLASIQK